MRILVTGGSGFIGTNLIESLQHAGHDLLNLDRSSPRNPNHGTIFKQVDILDAEHLTELVGDFKPTHVVHLAARTDLADGSVEPLYAANTTGTRNLINAMAIAYDGTLIDPFGGVDDLKAEVIRFVGNAEDRLNEDPRYKEFLLDLDRPQRMLRQFSEEHDIPFIDTTPALRKSMFNYFPREGHLNESGSTIVARVLYDSVFEGD